MKINELLDYRGNRKRLLRISVQSLWPKHKHRSGVKTFKLRAKYSGNPLDSFARSVCLEIYPISRKFNKTFRNSSRISVLKKFAFCYGFSFVWRPFKLPLLEYQINYVWNAECAVAHAQKFICAQGYQAIEHILNRKWPRKTR